jgi:hypothetical protein
MRAGDRGGADAFVDARSHGPGMTIAITRLPRDSLEECLDPNGMERVAVLVPGPYSRVTA